MTPNRLIDYLEHMQQAAMDVLCKEWPVKTSSRTSAPSKPSS